MRPEDVPEDDARMVRCPHCVARSYDACHRDTIIRGNRLLRVSHVARRRRWIRENIGEN